MRQALWVLVVAVTALPAHAESPRTRLSVAAAANLKLAADELERAFEAEHPSVDVALTFGASGMFFAQLRHGAPFDVFLSADREFPAQIIAAGLAAAGDERVYAIGKLVAWTPPGSKLDLAARGLAALSDASVKKIALANPAVAPFGRATEAALRNAGVYEAVKGRLVLGTSVAQAAQFATTGAADVSLLPYSLTFGKEFADGRVTVVPETLYPRIEQSGVVLQASKNPVTARAFLDFVTGEQGRAILAKYGYGLP